MPSNFMVCSACDFGQVTVARFDVLTVVLLRIQVFGDATLCQTLLDCLIHEDEGIAVF